MPSLWTETCPPHQPKRPTRNPGSGQSGHAQKDKCLSRTRGRSGCSARSTGCETVNTCAGVPSLPLSSQAVLSKLVTCYKPYSDLKLNVQKTKVMASSPITLGQIDGGKVQIVRDLFFVLQNHYGWGHDKPIHHIKKQRHQFATKGLYSQSYGFSSSHIWMSELDHKES